MNGYSTRSPPSQLISLSTNANDLGTENPNSSFVPSSFLTTFDNTRNQINQNGSKEEKSKSTRAKSVLSERGKSQGHKRTPGRKLRLDMQGFKFNNDARNATAKAGKREKLAAIVQADQNINKS